MNKKLYIIVISIFMVFKISALEVISVGDAIVDYMVQVEEDLLNQVPGNKGEWLRIDVDTFNRLQQLTHGDYTYNVGGSACNVSKGLASLGMKTALVGPVGKDDDGSHYIKSLHELGIVSHLKNQANHTSRVFCLVTPDGERTMRMLLADNYEFHDDFLKFDDFETAKLIHFDGYTIQHSSFIKNAMKKSKEAGLKVSYDLGNEFLINSNRELILSLLNDYVDLVFCNQFEAKTLTGKEPLEALDELSKLCHIAVITLNNKGVLVKKGAQTLVYPAFTVKNIDTTGAGDFFSSGFIYGYLKGLSIEQCAFWGTLLASMNIQQLGTAIHPDQWNVIHHIQNIINR